MEPKRRPRGSKLSPRGLQELQVEPKKASKKPRRAAKGQSNNTSTAQKAKTSIFDDPTTLFEGPERPWKANWRASWRSFWLYGGRIGAPKAILEAIETSLKHQVESKWHLECDLEGVWAHLGAHLDAVQDFESDKLRILASRGRRTPASSESSAEHIV